MVDQVLAAAEGTTAGCCSRRSSTGRKGEHAPGARRTSWRRGSCVRSYRRRGGTMLDDPPKLDLRKQAHDRGRGRSLPVKRRPRSQRLAESFETALRSSADGVARVIPHGCSRRSTERWRRARVLRSRFACPACGYSLTELEPRLFSFNNPVGACGDMRRPRRQASSSTPTRVVREPGTVSSAGGADPRLGPPQRPTTSS